MKKLLIIFAIFGFTSCCVEKPHRKDPVRSAVDNTVKELINNKTISY